jgi:hypothetical protein
MEKSIEKRADLKLDRTDIIPVLLWLLVFSLTWLFMHGAEHYLQLTPEALHKYFEVKWFLIAHITAGGGSLVLGLLQFWKKLRNFSWKLHRIIGILYLLAVLVSSVSAVVLAFSTAYDVNWAYAFSTQVWVMVWISATVIAYYHALKKNFELHEEWMVRSYIVTLAFIISGLALKTQWVQGLGSFADISPSFFWMGWSVPLYIYQVILSTKPKRGRSLSKSNKGIPRT